jgi:peptidyl-prolyl cis-trans isomerase C
MVPAFAEAAFLIPVGKVGQEPVKTQFGYHVVKVEDERVREKPTFDEIRPQLEQQLRQQAIRQEIQSLRDATDVTLLDIEGNPVVNAQDMSGQEPEDFTASDEVVDEPAEEVMEETIEDQVDDSSNEEEALENEGEETLEMDAAE